MASGPAPCRCLVLGPEGVGKTLLLKKLKALCDQSEGQDSARKADGRRGEGSPREENSMSSLVSGLLPTIPTVGSNVQEIRLSGGITCLLREYGGRMAPIWSKAYGDTQMVIYVIDASNSTQISAATVLLLEVLSARALEGKPCLLFFNKIDCPFAMSLVETKSIIRVDDIVSHANQVVTVADGSCVTEEGLERVLSWIRDYAINAERRA